MKRCPKCYSSFPDAEQFCELDGTTLVPDYPDSNPDRSVAREDWDQHVENAAVVPAYAYQASPEQRLRQSWKLLTVAAIAALAAGMVLFVVYQRMSRGIPAQSSEQTGSNEVATQQQVPLLPFRPSPSITPSPEPSPSPSAMPSPAVQAESARVALSSSPVSTGGDEKTRRGQVTIHIIVANRIALVLPALANPSGTAREYSIYGSELPVRKRWRTAPIICGRYAYCMLSAVCRCLLFAVCCLLSAVCCLLSTVYLLSHITRFEQGIVSEGSESFSGRAFCNISSSNSAVMSRLVSSGSRAPCVEFFLTYRLASSWAKARAT